MYYLEDKTCTPKNKKISKNPYPMAVQRLAYGATDVKTLGPTSRIQQMIKARREYLAKGAPTNRVRNRLAILTKAHAYSRRATAPKTAARPAPAPTTLAEPAL